MRDKWSNIRINETHPKAREAFTGFIDDAETGLDIIIRIEDNPFRTIEKENELFAQGRTKPGKIVTKSKGGQSYHNYGLAIDIAIMNPDGTIDTGFDMSKLLPYMLKYYSMEWGGNWHSIKDKPHFQLSYGYTWQQLFALYNAGMVDSNGYVFLNGKPEDNAAKTVS